MVQVGVVPQGPDNLLSPGGAALWVRYHPHVRTRQLEECGEFLSFFFSSNEAYFIKQNQKIYLFRLSS